MFDFLWKTCQIKIRRLSVFSSCVFLSRAYLSRGRISRISQFWIFCKRPVCLTVNYKMIEVLINISITEGGAVHFDSVYMERRRIRPLSLLFTSPSGNSCILFLLINFCFCCLTNFIYKTQGTSTLLSVTEKNSKLKVCSYWLKHFRSLLINIRSAGYDQWTELGHNSIVVWYVSVSGYIDRYHFPISTGKKLTSVNLPLEKSCVTATKLT